MIFCSSYIFYANEKETWACMDKIVNIYSSLFIPKKKESEIVFNSCHKSLVIKVCGDTNKPSLDTVSFSVFTDLFHNSLSNQGTYHVITYEEVLKSLFHKNILVKLGGCQLNSVDWFLNELGHPTNIEESVMLSGDGLYAFKTTDHSLQFITKYLDNSVTVYNTLLINSNVFFDLLVFYHNFMKKEEIVGYICPTDLVSSKINKGDIFTPYGPNLYVCKPKNHGWCYLPKEIVETWEPKYKDKSVSINVNGKQKVVVSNGKVYVNDKYEPTFHQISQKDYETLGFFAAEIKGEMLNLPDHILNILNNSFFNLGSAKCLYYSDMVKIKTEMMKQNGEI